MEKKDYTAMQPGELLTYFEEWAVYSDKNQSDMQALIHKEEIKSHLTIQLGKLVLL